MHFEVTTSAKLLGGEGVAYVIDRYGMRTADHKWQTRLRELPLAGMLIDFGTDQRP